MASSTEIPEAGEPSNSPLAADSSPTIILHILSPSLEAPNRITLNNLPLTTKVGELKDHIYRNVASQPQPETQRLIYRGKPLLNNGEILQNIVDPSDATSHSMHLVLPPRETHTARSDISSTSLRPAGQEGSLPSHTQLPLPDYLQQTQGLRFRTPAPSSGRPTPTLPGHPTTQVRVSFRGQLNHPRQAQEPQTTLDETRGLHQGRSSSNRNTNLTMPTEDLDQMGSSMPQPPSPNLHVRDSHTRSAQPTADTDQMPSSNIRARESNPLRRVRESSERGERRTRRHPAGSTSSNINQINQNFAWTPMQHSPALTLGTPSLSNTHGLNLLSMQQVIIGLETQLNWGVIPPIEQLSQIRTTLYQILDAQYQNPLVPRDGFVEGLLSRLSNLYVRADQLRIYRARLPNAPTSNNPLGNIATQNAVQANLYLLSSPSGYQGLVSAPINAPATAPAPTQDDTTRPVQPQELAQAPRAAAINNAINQALIHRRAGANIGPTDFVRNARRIWIRRIWLFIRLYFFCYLFSDSGTWSRVILVCLAVCISLLSETGAPQHIHRVVFGPIQRHLEGLVHLGEEGGANRQGQHFVNAQGDQTETRAGGPTGGDAAPGIQQQLRRVERSVALFLASLVPGIGERHIEVQNAAEAAVQNQERERLQEEERRAEEDVQPQDGPAAAQAQPAPVEQEN